MAYSSRYTVVADSSLLKLINLQYGIKGEKIRLYRTSQGRVFFIQCPDGRKVFKLYPPSRTDAAVQSTHIISYLAGCGYPVVQIIPAVSGDLYITADEPEGRCAGVLFEYASGVCIGYLHRWRENNPPDVHPLTRQFGRQVGRMHRLMEQYKGPLVYRGAKHFFDDLYEILRGDGYDGANTRDFMEYGNELKAMLENLPRGFYHADMHPGNTKYRGGLFTWMDFDKACESYRVMDFGWLLETDWVYFHDESIERSRRLFDEVYAGYGAERELTGAEIAAVYHCVAAVHYEAIVLDRLLGDKPLNPKILDREHDWLMRWRESCHKLTRG